MDNRFDFDSKKYMILLTIICVSFVIVTIKAFDYLPKDEEGNNYQKVESVDVSVKEPQPEPAKTVEAPKVQSKKGVLYRSNDSEIDLKDVTFEEIDAPKSPLDDIEEIPQQPISPNISSADAALKSIINAKKYTEAEQYSNALKEYKKAVEATQDRNILAECYEGISILYAKNKKYETALSFAKKANEIYPSFGTEFLIAKIYYSSGNTNQAITKINQILKQSF